MSASVPRDEFPGALAIIQIEEEAGGSPDGAHEGARWKSVVAESARFLAVQHGIRLFQEKTRQELGGPFFKDYGRSIKGLGGWRDGDDIFTNYIAHPMQGASSAFVFIHNDPGAEELEFGRSAKYWKSRLKALGFAALYSTQFELGPYSEATIGNVGKKAGTMGIVDLVITPIGGFGWMIGEDVLDRFVIRRLENQSRKRATIRFFRVLLNPTRSVANLLRFKAPWYRRGRSIRQPALEKDGIGLPREMGLEPVLEASRQPILELDHTELEQMLGLCCQ